MSNRAIMIGGSSGVAGSKVYKCADCEADVWIAPSGQRRLATHGPHRIVCLKCGLADMKRNNCTEVEPIRAEQLREIEQHLRRN